MGGVATLNKRIGVIMYQTSMSKGQELVAQRMVKEFIKLGYQAFLITSLFHDGEEVIPPTSQPKSGGFTYVEQDRELGIPVIRVNSYVAKWPPRRIHFRDFVSVLETIVDSFHLDVLITHSTLWNGPEDTAKFIEWRRYMKSVGGYQDPLVFCHMSHFQEPTQKRYSLTERSFRVAWNRLTLPQVFSTANLILVVTPLEKEAKIKMGAKPNKCFLFPGGVDEEAFDYRSRPDPESFKDLLKRFDIDDEKRIVSYLGSIEERKNPLAVLRIAESLKDREDVHFVIAGKGQSNYADKFLEAAKALSNVTYLGEISQDDKTALIEASRVNILLSRSEALGLAQLEFMYSGVPIVTSGVEGQGWLVRDGLDGIHVKGPDDFAGAAAAISRLCDDNDLWNEMSFNAKKRAADFTVSRLTEELDKALTDELIKERGLTAVPKEVRATIDEPENVLKSWSSGNWGVVATRRRLFIRRGKISRKVTEIPYSNVTSIEHTRRYPWRTLIGGAAVFLSLFAMFFAGSMLPQPLASMSKDLLSSLAKSGFAGPLILNLTLLLVSLAPFIAAATLFAVEARVGFKLRGPGKEMIYLPGQFRDVITFIRKMQDADFDRIMSDKKPLRSTLSGDFLDKMED